MEGQPLAQEHIVNGRALKREPWFLISSILHPYSVCTLEESSLLYSTLSFECNVVDEFILQKGHRMQLKTRILLFGDSCHSNSRDSYRLLEFNRKVIQKYHSDFITSLL